MDLKFQKAINQNYLFTILSVDEAPRQFVAETYVITSKTDEKYFCKIINKKLFIPRIKKSLPVLEDLYQSGIKRINYPIKTTSDDYYLELDDTLIVILNYIDAVQSYDYDNEVFGELIARVHKSSINNQLIKKEDFIYEYKEKYGDYLEKILNTDREDEVRESLKSLIKKYLSELEFDYKKFQDIASAISKLNHKMVVTHGDAPGNVLIKNSRNIYIVDWDEITLSPPERDVCFLDDDEKFMRGYRKVFPDFEVNEELKLYFMYLRYFDDIVEYFDEIFPIHEYKNRIKNFNELRHDCFEGWLRPAIRKIVKI